MMDLFVDGVGYYFMRPYILWLSFIIFLASIGRSFGVRRLYIQILLRIFEWGRTRIKYHESNDERKRDSDPDISEGTGNKLSRMNGITAENDLIDREVILSAKGIKLKDTVTLEDLKHEFELSDVMYFCKNAVESIIDDGVTRRFDAAELSSWNLLTRTNNIPEFISYRLTCLWVIGWFLRYVILLPFRFSLAIVAICLMIIGTAIIGFLVPPGSLKRWMYNRLSLTAYRIMARAFSAVITFHNIENRAKPGGICVANHTSPIDIVILGCDNTYAMVGQQQGGFFGIMQAAFNRGESHVWFNRSEASDRLAVSNRLREHVRDTNKLPMLIFPEGTCINNTSIMMFKKGSFETGGTIYPVAIKYDPRFADAFWNSSVCGLITHLFMIMTSWALVCEIWYLPPEHQLEDESSVQFANRVKAEIARQGGLVDLDWDGGLKRSKPKPNMRQKQQEKYSKTLLDLKED